MARPIEDDDLAMEINAHSQDALEELVIALARLGASSDDLIAMALIARAVDLLRESSRLAARLVYRIEDRQRKRRRK